MDYQINISHPLKFRHRKHGFMLIAPGVYSVPEEVDATMAELAVSQGIANKVPWTTPPMKPEPVVKFRRRANRRKTPPENKLAQVAENK